MSGHAFGNPAHIDLQMRPRTVSFENPTGAAGSAGAAHGGRKGRPSRTVDAGERVVLADLDGPGRIGHLWLTLPPMAPEHLRAFTLEVFYDGLDEPSISVPLPDFFGVGLGRAQPYTSALQAVQEGRGFNSWVPMPFRRHVRIEVTNGSPRRAELYYQVDLALGPVDESEGVLHASFRRENPTTMRRDFVIADGFAGPGRFLGCNVGVRVIHEPSWFSWYGEGEVKMFLDDDTDLPTWCGTGLEDYVGTAWGMGAHQTPLQGVQLLVTDDAAGRPMPDMAAFYRWHLPDPVIFRDSLRVTIQQIGAVILPPGSDAIKDEIDAHGIVAGGGWRHLDKPWGEWFAVCERVDDYCATAYVYCLEPQAVPRVDIAAAVADIAAPSAT
ncbi:MAG: hypothetical protein RJA49_1825 [Actinomycetota bacterium]